MLLKEKGVTRQPCQFQYRLTSINHCSPYIIDDLQERENSTKGKDCKLQEPWLRYSNKRSDYSKASPISTSNIYRLSKQQNVVKDQLK